MREAGAKAKMPGLLVEIIFPFHEDSLHGPRVTDKTPMLTVVCVLKLGGIYNHHHVWRLQEMIAQHMEQPYRFVCVDNSPFPKWWAKISLFEPGRFNGRVLYLDLDVTITGGLDDLADYPVPFAIINDWNRQGFNSSVMAWDKGAAEHLFTEFEPPVMDRLHGDQNWIEEIMPQATPFPPAWCRSYKKDIKPRLNDSVPKDCRVVVYHGFPKPWDLETA